MIAWLTGKIIGNDSGRVIIDVHGVGYEVFCTRSAAEKFSVGESTEIIIYTEVREDAIKLYGFVDQLEKQVFLLLTTVKGIGAKSGADILSRLDRRQLLKMIGAGDLNALQSVRGIGKKTAERIIVELKDKVGEFALRHEDSRLVVEKSVSSPVDDAVMALVSLGFSEREARAAVERAGAESGALHAGGDSGEIVRQALRFV